MTATAELADAAALIAWAQETCYRAADAGMPAEDPAVTDAMAVLAGSLRLCRAIESGATAPADAYWQVEEMPAEQARGTALLLAAQDAAADAGQLVRVIADNHGDKMAALVSGKDKGESWH